MGELLKRGTGILDLIFIFSGGVNIWGMIHQRKGWYSLGPSRTSMVGFFLRKIFSAASR